MIRFAEKRGWVHNVKWPKPERIQAKLVNPSQWSGDPRPDDAQQRRNSCSASGSHCSRRVDTRRSPWRRSPPQQRCPKPVVYEHFGGKEGLYAVIVDRELQTLLKRITDALDRRTPPCCSSRRAWPCSTTSRVTPTDSGCWSELPSPDWQLRQSHRRGRRTRRALVGPPVQNQGLQHQTRPMYSQMLVGMVALTGQWWLDVRKPGKDEVVAHLVNLTYNGFSHLEHKPTLDGH